MKRLAHLAEDKRTPALNQALGVVSSFVAGGINAGGFMVVGRYTSHITGIVASAADTIAMKNWTPGLEFTSFVILFFLGSFVATLLIGIAEKLRLHSRYSLSFILAALCLMGIAIAAKKFGIDGHQAAISGALFFSMGVQNATVSRLSNYEVRATHMTGIITDLGIECGKLFTGSSAGKTQKLKFLLAVVASFFIGGILGAILFSGKLGISSLWIFSAVMMAMSTLPVVKDINIRYRHTKMRHPH